MGWDGLARIDVEKSSSHQLSQIEIAGDNPCSQQLSSKSYFRAPTQSRRTENGNSLRFVTPEQAAPNLRGLGKIERENNRFALLESYANS